MNEIWKDIVGYEGYYQVSNLGKVKSLDRVIKHSLGGTKNKKGNPMKLKITHKGYNTVKLCKNGVCKHPQVHRLVAIAFIPNHDNLPEVNHKKGIKTDNRVSELEWITRLNNARHAFENKLVTIKNGSRHHFFNKKGLKCHNSKKVISIITGEILNQGEAASKSNISQAGLSLMLSGKIKNRTEFIKLGQGKDAVRETLEGHQKMADEIEEKIRQIANN